MAEEQTKTPEQLQAELDAANTALAEAQGTIDSQKKTILDMKHRQKKAGESTAAALGVVNDSNGEKYAVISKKFKWAPKGETKESITLEMMASDPKLVDKIVAAKLGVLKKIEKKQKSE